MTESAEAAARKKPGAAVDQVIDAILTRIGSGGLGPGEQLRQEDLAEDLGVSRVPVREALHALAEQRVLVHLKHRGFFVAKRSPAELAQFGRLLQIIEDEVTASIAWPDEDTLERLHALNERMLAVAENYDATETFSLNRQFHFTIFNLSPLTIMIDELDRLWRLAQPFIVAEMMTPEARLRRVEEHRRIIDELANQDRDAVIEAMRRHRHRSGRRAAALDAQANAVATVTTGNAMVRFLSAPGT